MRIKLLNKHCKPYRAHEKDSGLDLRANIDDSIWLQPLDTVIIPTGIAIELPEGYEAQVRPRSSLNKLGILAALGTIDNEYRGEIKVVLTNVSMQRYEIKPFERIAQMVIAPVYIPDIQYTNKLTQTQRGINGFGSTGRI